MNVRLLSATHKDLGDEVQQGRFRQDLYYRLNVIQIRVPPLRERLDDLPVITERVLERTAREAGVWPPQRLTADAMQRLARYAFPGNVRELENLLHRAVALSSSEQISGDDLGLPEALLDAAATESLLGGAPELASVAVALAPAPQGADAGAVWSGSALPDAPLPDDLALYLDRVERDILERALDHHRNNRTAAGASLGLSLRQMRYRMARLGVTVGGEADERE